MNETQALPWYRSAENWQLGIFGLMLAAVSLSIAVSQISLGLVLALMLYRGIVRGDWPARTGVEGPALALFLWALAMIPLSSDVSQSAVYFRRFFLFAALWAGSSLATSAVRRRWMLGAMLFGALGASVYGEILLIHKSGGLFARRLLTSTNPMTSGAMLMLVVMAVIGYLFVRGPGRRYRTAIAVAALPVAFALLQTMTRSALLGLVVGVGALFLLIKPRWFVIFGAVVLVLLAVVIIGGESVVPAGLWRRINPEFITSGSSTSARLEMWRAGWDLIKAHPWTGVGDCDLQSIMPQYYGNSDTTYYGHLHNNLVMLAAIWGLPGLIFSQIFVFAPLVLLIKKWRALAVESAGRIGDRFGAAWIAAAIAVWAAFFAAGLTEWYFGDAEPMLLYLAIIGVALGKGIQPKETP